jgi:hypothetical protein
MDTSDIIEHYVIAARACTENNRHTQLLRMAESDCYYIAAGGMSWGDNPSEEFNKIAAACEINELHGLMMKYAREDFNVHSKGTTNE